MNGKPCHYRGNVSWTGSDATPWQETDITENCEVARPDVPAAEVMASEVPAEVVPAEVVPADVVPADVGALGTVAAELDAIEDALGRIDAGSYGRCRACGTPIADADLEADPLVLACAAHR